MTGYTYDRKTRRYMRWFGVVCLRVCELAMRDMAASRNWKALALAEENARREGRAVYDVFRFLACAIRRNALQRHWEGYKGQALPVGFGVEKDQLLKLDGTVLTPLHSGRSK